MESITDLFGDHITVEKDLNVFYDAEITGRH